MNCQAAVKQAQLSNYDLLLALKDIEILGKNIDITALEYIPDLSFQVTAPASTVEFNPTNLSNIRTGINGGLTAEYLQRMPYNADTGIKYSLDYSINYTNRIEKLEQLVQKIGIFYRQEIFSLPAETRTIILQKKKLFYLNLSTGSIINNFAYNVKTAYFNNLREKHILSNNSVMYSGDEEIIKAAEIKFKSGIIPEYALLDYQADFFRSRAQYFNSKQNYLSAQRMLYFYLNEDPETAIQFEDEDISSRTNTVFDIARMIENALKYDQNTADMNFAIFSSSRNIKFIQENLRPAASLQASADWNYTTNYTRSNALQGISMGASLELGYSFLSDSFINYLKIKNEKTAIAREKLRLEERLRFFKKKITDDLSSLEAALFLYNNALERYNYIMRDYEISKQRFDLGAINSWDMIQSKNRYFDAVNAFISAKYNYLLLYERINKDYYLE
ncbi:MAG: hypothetical protein A2096_15375 [Spirochaetes bacterium GWF1_41_5]|nr:MAG: hypothetical protein A2096_15375 [Spirochaetes bacterium GWF1_41_5]